MMSVHNIRLIRLASFIMIVILSVARGYAQKHVISLSIEDALVMGREHSIASKENLNTMRIAYWQYRNYRADMFPTISFTGTLPTLNRSLSSYQQSDGVYKFIRNNYISEEFSIAISQAIPFTGGRVSLQSNVERMDQLDNSGVGSFLTIPFNLTITQPIFAYNQYKWDRKIEPLKYENSRQNYVASIEDVNIKTVTYYFDFLLAISDKKIAQQNLLNAQKLYDIALAKKKLGTISDDELMQLHVSLLNANAKLITADNYCSEKMHILRNYLGLSDELEIVPVIPDEKIIPVASADMIREKAYSNNPIYKDFKIRLLEAEANLVQAKRNRGPNVELNLSIGNTGSDRNFFKSYTHLQNRQIAQIGINIPILDWGKRKGQYELAKSQYSLVKDRVERDGQDFKETVRSLIDNIFDQPKLVQVYEQADSIAQERYKIAIERFSLGDINVIDINYAEQEKDNARRQYINQLYLSWLYYYNLRYITLYDFETGQNLIFENIGTEEHD